ncbi:MAG: hypothetical protein ACK5P0_02690 [bacterium]|jgi:hypothetical protein
MTDLRKAAEPVEYTGNGTAGREADVRPTGFLFQMPKREWVGLTEDEVWELVDQSLSKKWGFLDEQAFAKAIEAKLKEKNT